MGEEDDVLEDNEYFEDDCFCDYCYPDEESEEEADYMPPDDSEDPFFNYPLDYQDDDEE